MAKELLIMRHAKSSWDDESLSDHERPLNKRGRRDAPRMAQLLSEHNIVPDLVITSSANRALSTARIVSESLELGTEIQDDFYLAAPNVYLEVLANLSVQFSRPMVIGHNPGLEHLVFVLTGAREFMPTAAVARIKVPIDDWSGLETCMGQAELLAVYRPKEVF